MSNIRGRPGLVEFWQTVKLLVFVVIKDAVVRIVYDNGFPPTKDDGVVWWRKLKVVVLWYLASYSVGRRLEFRLTFTM